MATQLFAYTATTAADSGQINSLPGVQTTGVIGFGSVTPGLQLGNALTGLPYSGFPFNRYVQSGGPANATIVVDVVFPRGRDNVAASYCVSYTVAAGALT